MNIDGYLDPENGDFDYLVSEKKAGRIRHLGFSVHGSYDVMKRFLEAYGNEMEFCQIQLNWLDWEFQDAKLKVELCREYGLPVWVMEPLRGGKLTRLSSEDEEKLKKLRPDEIIPAWSFRYLQTIPEVRVILSGMSNLDQMKANIKTFETCKPLNETEFSALAEIADGMVNRIAIPCTGCRYCVDHCPQELDIPRLLELYNEHAFTGGGFIAPMALMAINEDHHPTACVGCRSCEAVCPQQMKISEVMTAFSEML